MTSPAHDTRPAQPEVDAAPDASTPVPPLPPPPTKHQLALMIWIAVFPTLTVLNLALGGWLKTLAPVPRTFILATVAVPIVIYGLMPQLHRLRSRLLSHAGRHHSRQT
jgi:antibiotic biosynthesis monooxygenase (ABM) superfamily enzyme